MAGRFLKIMWSQAAALAMASPGVAQSEAPAAFFRKGASFQQRVEQRLNDHEERLTRLEVAGTPPRRASGASSGKNPVASSAARTPAGRAATSSKRSTATKSTGTKPGPASGASGAHTVRSGETPSAIARKYGVSVAALLRANGLASDAIIRPGQRLVLPGAGKAKTRPPASALAAPVAKAQTEAPPVRPPSAEGSEEGFGQYTVQRGDTVRALALRFGVSEKEFMRLNGLKDATKLRAGAAVRYPRGSSAAETAEAFAQGAEESEPDRLPGGWRWHTLERGESLSQAAARYGVDRASLEKANALPPGAAIYEGMKLKIPPAGVDLGPPEPADERPPAGEDHKTLAYQVQKGDTLEALAKTFATTPDALRTLNNLTADEPIVAGRRLFVPNNLFD